MYISMYMYTVILRVCATHHNDTRPHTTTHTSDAQPHTQQNTNNAPSHTHTTHTHCTQRTHTHTAHRVRANMPGPERWWTVPDKGKIFVESRDDTDVQIVRDIPLSLFPSGSLELKQFLSGKANDWRNRQHVVLDFNPKLHNGQDAALTLVNPWYTWQLHMWRWIVLFIVFCRRINLTIQRLKCHCSRILTFNQRRPFSLHRRVHHAKARDALKGCSKKNKREYVSMWDSWEDDSQRKETHMTHGWTDALVRYLDRIAKIDISHIATAEQRGRSQNLLDLWAFGEDLNGPPSASRLGYQELKNVVKGMQEQWRKDVGIGFIPTSARKLLNDQLHPDTKRVPSVGPEYELGWILRRRKANLNRSAIIFFVYLDPRAHSGGTHQIGTHGTSAIGKTISGRIMDKSGTKLKCAIEC